MINKIEATRLFEKCSCLVGTRDVIPEQKAMKFVTDKAIAFARRMSPRCSSVYGIGDYDMCYLTQEGFFLAVTYMNVAEEKDERKTEVTK